MVRCACFVVLMLAAVIAVESSVVFPTLDLTYPAAQLTPRGRDHPIVILDDEIMIFESPDIPPEYYAGKVLFMAYRPYWDLDVCMYESVYGIKCAVITSTNPVTPGSNINKGYNNCTFSCAFEMPYPDFAAFADIYKQLVTEALQQPNGTLPVVTVSLDGTDVNQWKEMAWSPLFWINIVLSTMFCLFFISFGFHIIHLMVKNNKAHMKIWLAIVLFIIGSGLIGPLGLVDFNCMLQLLPYRACNIFSAIRPPFVFAAVNLLIFSMMDAGRLHIGVNYGFPAKAWLFWTLSIAYFCMEIICAVTITFLTVYEDIIALLSIWLTLELGFMTYTAALNVVVSIKTLLQIRQVAMLSGKLEERKKTIKKIMKHLITISSLTVVYVIFVGLVFMAVNYPWFLGCTWFVYNMILNILSTMMLANIYMLVTKGIDKRETTHSKDSNPSTAEGTTTMDTIYSKRSSSTLELKASVDD